jgi:hypothetical protein
MTFPKHEATTRPRKGKKQSLPAALETAPSVVVTGPMSERTGEPRSMQHEINHVAGMDGIEGSLDNLVTAVCRLTHDDNTVGVRIGQNRYGLPVKLTLHSNDEDDTLDRLVTAFERIADSVAKLAGLTRPRLEEWHHQDAYEPRYHDVPGGEAPGPRPLQVKGSDMELGKP